MINYRRSFEHRVRDLIIYISSSPDETKEKQFVSAMLTSKRSPEIINFLESHKSSFYILKKVQSYTYIMIFTT